MSKKIFILHGWTYTLSSWDECVQFLEAQGFSIVWLHVPGLTEATNEVWTLKKYVDWLHEKLSHEENVILLGHSNGGRIALAYVSEFPEKISRLILEDSAGIFHNELPLRMKRLIFGTAAKIGKKVTSSQVLRKVLYRTIGAHDYERATPTMRETMKNLISIDLIPLFSSITTPTLILWGEKDRATPVEDAYLMHKNIKNSKLVIIPDAGHSPHKTHPQKIAEEISAWLASS